MTGQRPPGWPTAEVDLVVVGAGIVGLGHAARAVELGLSVVVVERDAEATGASVRNFGHGCVTAQAGDALRYARRARDVWQRLAGAAGFWLGRAGTVVVARHDDELAVLADLAAARGEEVAMFDVAAVRDRVPGVAGVVGGAWLPGDLRVDPREALPALTRHLADLGVRFAFCTTLLGVDDGGVHTSRGRIDARHVVVAIGADVGQLFPDLAADAGVTRCALHMLRVTAPGNRRIDPAVFTGWSLLRYGAFAVSPALDAVRERLTREQPAAMAAGLHLMLTQRPDGDLVIGDTHSYGPSYPPFRSEKLDDLVLAETAALLGVPALTVRERWQGVYASAPAPFLVAAPAAPTRVVSVTAGIGMTTAFGLAAEVVDDLVA